MNRLVLPFLLVAMVLAAAMLGTRSPNGPSQTPSAGNELEIAAPQLERLIEQFLSRVRGHNAALPITEVEARRIEAMLGALGLEVPRGTVQSGAALPEVARAAASKLTPMQLAQLPGLVSANESTRRALPSIAPRPGDDVERRSAELRLNGIPLDPTTARDALIKPGDRIEAKGAVHYPLRIGDALIEFRDETRLTVKEDELALDEGQILVRTQERLAPTPEPASSAPAAASPAPASVASVAAPPRGIPRIAGAMTDTAPPRAVSASPGAPPSTIGRFKIGTPHSEMYDIGTAWVATAERRRSRAEVLSGRVLMKSKRTGQWVELDPGQFAWTTDDGTLMKREGQIMIPSPGAGVATGSPGSGPSSGGVPPPPPDIADESTLIPSGNLPKTQPVPGARGSANGNENSSAPAQGASPSPPNDSLSNAAAAAAPPTPTPNQPPVQAQTQPVLSGGAGQVVNPGNENANENAPPVTPTPAPPDTE